MAYSAFFYSSFVDWILGFEPNFLVSVVYIMSICTVEESQTDQANNGSKCGFEEN